MRAPNGQIDWNRTEARAREMTVAELHYARVDIAKTMPFAEALDRENGTSNAGYYADEASVYAREMTRRIR